MSFCRIGGPSRRKRPTRKRPGWDDSVNDLTVHRATPEEILLRRESHKSKNHISVKLEKMRKDKQKKKLTGAEAKQLAIMKEVLYDQQQLESVLAKSDTMMAVVKDLFGDDPKRFMGFPNVTTAPRADTSVDGSSSLVASVPDIYTRSEKLSDSVMDQSALNDVEDSDSEEEEEDEIDQPTPISYEPKMNLQRFQEFLQEEEKMSVQRDPPSLVSRLGSGSQASRQASGDRNNNSGNSTNISSSGNNISNNGSSSSKRMEKESALNMQLLATILSQTGQGDSPLARDPQMMNILLAAMASNGQSKEPKTPPRNAQNSPPLPSDRTPPSAMNDTKKIKRTKKVAKSPNASSSVGPNTTASMTDMRKVLHELESELATYEHQTGRQPQRASGKTETFTGYTTALVDAVSRLTRYLKETDLRVRTEVTLREQLTQDVYQLRTIIDALATDLIVTQEEYGKLYSEHQRYKDNTIEELSFVKKQLQELRSHVIGTGAQPGSVSHEPAEEKSILEQQCREQERQQQHFQDSINTSKKSDDNKTSSPLPSHFESSTHSGSGEYPALPSRLHATEVPTSLAAIMLSPPVRKTRVYTNAKAAQPQAPMTDVAQVASQASEPPRLTQAPPVINTVSVPRPIPLVQSNVTVPLLPTTSAVTAGTGSNQQQVTTGGGHQQGSEKSGQKSGKLLQVNDLTELVKLGDQTEQQLNHLREMAVEEALNNPAMQSLMQTQIEELNRQQEEARRRLRDLLQNQKFQQRHLQQQLGAAVALEGDYSPDRQDGTVGEKGSFKAVGQVSVSPPISPISLTAERPVLKDTGNIPQTGHGRGITVSLPMADLDVSGDSMGSPRSEGNKKPGKT